MLLWSVFIFSGSLSVVLPSAKNVFISRKMNIEGIL